jgi:hypothetical protein
VLTKAWKFNCIRLCCYVKGYHRHGYKTYEINNDMDAIIEAYTKEKVVCMIEAHDWTGGGIDYYSNSDYKKGGVPRSHNNVPETLDDPFDEFGGKSHYETQYDIVMDFFGYFARKYRDNPYVWFNVFNEPGVALTNYYDKDGNKIKEIPDYWMHMHGIFVERIRAMGNNNIVVFDGIASGQDHGEWWSESGWGKFSPRSSAILTYGEKVVGYNGAQHHNVLFSFHVYDMWGNNADVMDQYINAVHEKKLGLIIGEAGCYTNKQSSAKGRAQKYMWQNKPLTRGVGILAWHLQPGDGMALVPEGTFSKINDWENPTNLNWLGKPFWEATHGRGFGLGGDLHEVPSSIPRSVELRDFATTVRRYSPLTVTQPERIPGNTMNVYSVFLNGATLRFPRHEKSVAGNYMIRLVVDENGNMAQRYVHSGIELNP